TMFTGVIEHLGIIHRLDSGPSGGKLTIHAATVANQLAVSASIAVNGCCLTIVHHEHEHFSADLSPETLAKTAFSSLKPGARVNLRPPLPPRRRSRGPLRPSPRRPRRPRPPPQESRRRLPLRPPPPRRSRSLHRPERFPHH